MGANQITKIHVQKHIKATKTVPTVIKLYDAMTRIEVKMPFINSWKRWCQDKIENFKANFKTSG